MAAALRSRMFISLKSDETKPAAQEVPDPPVRTMALEG
ncbi:hypothetical protein EMEDMD4_310058 [Sinorhizobium medicae]|uniref:Uncharacterized protein n=1 Tax=Sinorhizobium medicae TaxID=110321 RepID=A0A508X0V2_9HYPH|nr:hypothetical protein EMEDMD4_310058 [Sinorhizobium medicae]